MQRESCSESATRRLATGIRKEDGGPLGDDGDSSLGQGATTEVTGRALGAVMAFQKRCIKTERAQDWSGNKVPIVYPLLSFRILIA